MSGRHYWKVEHQTLGGHVHITLRCGSQPHSRGKCGDLVVTVDEWEEGLMFALSSLLLAEFEERT